MKALTQGRYLGRDGEAALFDVGLGATIAVRILEGDIGRVTLKPKDGYRLDRGWSIAPGGLEPAYEGRPRDSLEGFACPKASVTENDGKVVLSAGGLTAEVTLSPFGIAWRRAGEDKPFLQDRTTQAYLISPRTGAISHFMARD
jgi:alpha-glucosidase